MPVTRLAEPFGKWATSQSSVILSRKPGIAARTVIWIAVLPPAQAAPLPPTVFRKLVGVQNPSLTPLVSQSNALTDSGEFNIDFDRSGLTNWPPSERTAGT